MEGKRLNMYTEIHKGMRLALFQTVMTAGTADLAEAEGLESLQAAWAELQTLLQAHADNEERYAHPLFDHCMPGVRRALENDHEEQRRVEAELEAHMTQLVGTEDSERRVAMGLEFYRRLSLFLADYLPHIFREEAIHMRNLWDHYTDEELRRVVAVILNAESDERLELEGRVIVQGLNFEDRIAFMGAVGDLLEPRVAGLMQELTEKHLPAHELEKMQQAMAAAHGGKAS